MQDTERTIIAMIDNQVMGTASRLEEHESMRVCSVAVDPLYQKRRVADHLMRGLEEIAQRSGCYELFLQTAWAMTEAIALHEGLGYRREGYQPKHFHGEDFLMFGKLLR